MENDLAAPAHRGPMSSFRGRADEIWSLARAVDAMRDAARAGGRPGLVWIAGIVYPSLKLGVSLAAGAAGEDSGLSLSFGLPSGSHPMLAPVLGGGVMLLVLLPICGRLMAGLARVAAPHTWRQLSGPRGQPRLAAIWQAGRGLTLSAVGMWILLGLLQIAATILVLSTASATIALITQAGGSVLAWLGLAILAGPTIALLSLYIALLSMLHQLALQSLVHNRRGVGSALLHAWRIARNDPMATARTLALDLVLYASILFLSGVLAMVLGETRVDRLGLLGLCTLALSGFAGVTRAGFWSRAYRALGGLSPDDRVPGLGAD